MRVSSGIPADMSKAGPAAKALEDLGYDAGATAETQHDAFLPAAIAAEHTQRLEIGTSIAVAFARNPMVLAQVGHDINAFSKGRFNLGLGTQVSAHITKRFSMPWSDPAARMREMVAAMHAIWDCWYKGEKLAFHGKYYTHSLMTPFFTPRNIEYGRPKVMLAAVGPIMTKVAAEVTDGILCHGFTTPKYLMEVTVPMIEKTIEAKGRDRSKFEIVASLFTAAGDTEEEIEKALARTAERISFYGSTPAYKGVFELHGWYDLHPKLNRLSKEGKWDEMAKSIPREVIETFTLFGTPENIVEQRKKIFGGKIDRSGVGFELKDPDRIKALIAQMRAA